MTLTLGEGTAQSSLISPQLKGARLPRTLLGHYARLGLKVRKDCLVEYAGHRGKEAPQTGQIKPRPVIHLSVLF